MKVRPFAEYLDNTSRVKEATEKMEFDVLSLVLKGKWNIIGYRFVHREGDTIYISDVNLDSLQVHIKKHNDKCNEILQCIDDSYISSWEIEMNVVVGEVSSIQELEIIKSVIDTLNTELNYHEVMRIAKLCYYKGGSTIEECWEESNYDSLVRHNNGKYYTLYQLIDTMKFYKSEEEERISNMKNWY